MPYFSLRFLSNTLCAIALISFQCDAYEIENLSLNRKVDDLGNFIDDENIVNDTLELEHHIENNFKINKFEKSTFIDEIFDISYETNKKYERNLFKMKGNNLFKMTYHNVLQCIIDLMIFWKRKDAIFLIDNYPGIKVKQLKNYLNLSLFRHGVKIRFDVLIINAEFDFKKTLKYETSTVLNFVVICRENEMHKIIETAKLHGVFTANNTWIIANHRIPEIFFSTIITAESLVTVIVYNSSFYDPQKFDSNSESSSINRTGYLRSKNPILKTYTDFQLKQEDRHWHEQAFSTHFNIYDIFYIYQQNKIEYVKFAHWNPQHGLHVLEFFEKEDDLQKLRGRTVRIGGFSHKPYVNIARKEDENVKFTGYMTEIIEMLMEYFNANATYMAFESVWGILLNGTYTGLVNRLHKKEVDVSMNGYSITPDREAVLNYLAPLAQVDWSLGYKMPISTVPPTTYLYPFSLEVWIFIFAIMVVVAIVLALVMLWSPEWANSNFPSLNVHSKKFRILTWTYLDEVLKDPPGISARFIFGVVLIGVFMSFILYTSVFTSFLAYRDLKLPIKSTEDLIDNNDYGCVVLRNTLYEDLTRRAKSELFKQLWDKKIKRTEEFSLGKSISDGIQKMLRGKTVFVCDGTTIVASMNKSCIYTVIRTALMRDDLFLVTRSDFPYNRIFYIRMLRIKEGGLIHRLSKVYGTRSTPICNSGMANASSSFGIEQVVGLFFVLFCGIMVSFVGLAVEYCLILKTKRTHV